MVDLIKNVTLGSDPEVFIQDVETGKMISAIGLVPGYKYEPHLLSNDGHMVQHDNVMAEFNIPPCVNVMEWTKNLRFCLSEIQKIIGATNLILIKPSALFEDDQLDNPIALETGCSVDFNAYTEEVQPRVELAVSNWRYAGKNDCPCIIEI
jgi:hypothetical protein